MRYRSTRGSDYFGFREVLFAGLANDGGLFIPENWPNINHKDINRNVSYEDLTEIILSPFIYTKSLNLIFIVLTVVKAYYITWDFMHMRDETKSLRRLVVWTAVFLICYLVFILLQEGGYIESVYTDGFIKRDF